MSGSDFSQFTNQYELSKTLRFELKPSKNFIPDLEKGDIQELIKQFEKIQDSFLDIFVHKNDFEEEGKIVFKKERRVKYGWLRSNTKQSFYDWQKEKNKNEKDYFLTEIKYLPKEFLRWINEWQELAKQLDSFVNKNEESQERKSDIALILRGLLKRKNFSFIQSFVNSVMDIQDTKGTVDDPKIIEFKKLLEETYINLKSCEQQYLPAQSGGVLLHKASINYYALNKTPKEYKGLKEDKEKQLKYNLSRYIYNREKYKKIEFECSDSWLIKIGIGTSFKRKNLDEAYFELKNWKAKQKSDFLEAVAKDTDKNIFMTFRDDFPLFDTSDENFEKLYRLTKELDNTDGEDAKKIAQQRGSFFNKPGETIQTKNYHELCELFKRVAMKRGKIIAEIKGIVNEEVQSQLLDSWALVAEEGEKKSVIFIPRESKELSDNHKKAHDFLDKSEVKNRKKEESDITLYHFKSLTLRALEKLCFKESYENTFMPEIRKEIKFIPKYKEEWYEEKNNWKLIKFYQQVLQTQYVSKNLDLVDFGGLQEVLDKKDFNNLQEFESALEKACYIKVPIQILKEVYQKFISDFGAKEFEMTTRSIAGNKKENAHAKIWKNFWSDENKEKNYTISRLNPEMSIFYRETLDTSEGNRNRYSKPCFTLATNISLNATAKKANLAFKTTQDIKKHIDDFNKDFKKNFDGKWVYGIDRGLKELATLNVVKFSDEKNEFRVSRPKEFAKIPVYTLKDENLDLLDEDGNIKKNAKGETRKVRNNISEVLEEGVEPDSDIFEKQEVSSIDLTQAKLIKGHIILNGDPKTYLKLKELSAKRRIFELLSTSKIDKDSAITGKKNFIIGDEKIYFVTDLQKEDKYWGTDRKAIKDDLKKYLAKIDEKNKFGDLEPIEKINHLRDAITANMVGILFHLQDHLKMKGFIGLENLDVTRKEILENEAKENKKMIEEHFDQSNEDISRRLEWALYRKFANMGCVPPQIKESILLRDDFATYQIGILKFVKVGNTSRGCPNCEYVWKKGCGKKCKPRCDKCLENNKYKESKENNIYICKDVEKCEFSTEQNHTLLEQNLHNSDEVAAYNVAKNAFDNLYN